MDDAELALEIPYMSLGWLAMALNGSPGPPWPAPPAAGCPLAPACSPPPPPPPNNKLPINGRPTKAPSANPFPIIPPPPSFFAPFGRSGSSGSFLLAVLLVPLRCCCSDFPFGFVGAACFGFFTFDTIRVPTPRSAESMWISTCKEIKRQTRRTRRPRDRVERQTGPTKTGRDSWAVSGAGTDGRQAGAMR